MVQQAQSLVASLIHHAQNSPNAIALRHKKLGLWQHWTWQQLLVLTERYALALQRLGFQKDQTFLWVSTPNVDVVAISLAVQALGGKLQLIDQDVEYLKTTPLIHHLAILQPDYILLEQLEHLPSVDELHYHPSYIFYIEQNDLNAFDHEYIIDVASLLDNIKPQQRLDLSQLRITESQLAFGFERVEHGQRQRVYYSHQELLDEAQHLIEQHQLTAQEEAFIARAFSSVGHIRYLWSAWLLAGFCLNIPETLNTRDQDRKIIAPTLVLGTQATFGRVEQLILKRLPQAQTWLAKTYHRALLNIQQQQQSVSVLQRIVFALYKQVVLEEIGFSRLKTALIVGQPAQSSTQNFYQAFGVQLQHWGQRPEWQNSTSIDSAKAGSALPQTSRD